jgi:hypothetical protein
MRADFLIILNYVAVITKYVLHATVCDRVSDQNSNPCSHTFEHALKILQWNLDNSKLKGPGKNLNYPKLRIRKVPI